MREKQNQNSTVERKSKIKQKNLYTKTSEIKRAMFSNQPMIVLLYKEAFLNTNELYPALPIVYSLQMYGSPKLSIDMGVIIIEKELRDYS